ncbi:MAG: DUF3090 family protein [Actinomycetota bacterium]|nr:DUF3090 family protein [Actinomycetota bacterium]
MSVFYDFDEVDAFTLGAVGRPGERVFFLQARRGAIRVTVKCEKQQAAAIADYLRRVLNDLPEPTEKPIAAAMELATPVEAAFVLGPVGLGYDRSNDRVLVQLEEVVEVDEEGEPVDDEAAADRGHLRVFLTRNQAHAFCAHADAVVSAGRPACIWCAHPIDPDGHACPRMN